MEFVVSTYEPNKSRACNIQSTGLYILSVDCFMCSRATTHFPKRSQLCAALTGAARITSNPSGCTEAENCRRDQRRSLRRAIVSPLVTKALGAYPGVDFPAGAPPAQTKGLALHCQTSRRDIADSDRGDFATRQGPYENAWASPVEFEQNTDGLSKCCACNINSTDIDNLCVDCLSIPGPPRIL